MEFLNFTPFSALCFAALDKHGVLWRVVAMKVAYRLVHSPEGWQAQVMDDEPAPLTLADEPWSDDLPGPGADSVRLESDLAPSKARCDVVVLGHSHAPHGKPSARWQARLRVLALQPKPAQSPAPLDPPQPLNPLMQVTAEQWAQWRRRQAEQAHAEQTEKARAGPQQTEHVLLDKRLQISGPHHFSRVLLMGYERDKPQLATSVPLRWEHAFGGASFVAQPPAKAQGAPKNESQGEAPPLINAVCFSNPTGCGWAAKGWMRALRKAGLPIPDSLPAPQLEPVGARQRWLHEETSPKGAALDARAMRDIAADYPHQSANLGFVGRAWAPRLALAGTYDKDWAAQPEALPPQDFDDGYWNGAPQDQQIATWPHGPQQACIELTNLCDPSLSPGLRQSGVLRVPMPLHRPFVLMRLQGGDAYVEPLVTDTVVIDTDAMTVSLTHRVGIPDGAHIRALEARFETRPEAPLLRWADEDEDKGQGEEEDAITTALPATAGLADPQPAHAAQGA